METLLIVPVIFALFVLTPDFPSTGTSLAFIRPFKNKDRQYEPLHDISRSSLVPLAISTHPWLRVSYAWLATEFSIVWKLDSCRTEALCRCGRRRG